MREYISNEIIIVVKKIATEYPDTVFCGSLGLVLNNKLHRDVKDIDILVNVDYVNNGGFFDNFRSGDVSKSHKFMVGKDEVLSFKLKIPIFNNDVLVDVLYNKDNPPKYNIMEIDGLKIKVEKPEAAIKAKLGYIVNDRSIKSVLKHLKDLIYLVDDKDLIINAIDNSEMMKEEIVDGSLPF